MADLGRGRPSPPRASIVDVARQAGVSVATVSRALRGMANVSAETRQATPELVGRPVHRHDHVHGAWRGIGRDHARRTVVDGGPCPAHEGRQAPHAEGTMIPGHCSASPILVTVWQAHSGAQEGQLY